jgi:L-alanine-DL-glutamate epimerase-like enolase superfamily enzyme
MPMPVSLDVAVETWPIAGRFTISRGSKTEAIVVVATLRDGIHAGRGECVPYARYGETVEGVVEAIRSMATPIGDGLDRLTLQSALPPGAARNALDCAFWDLEAKRSGRRAADLAGLPPPGPVDTAFTISLATPREMGDAARAAASRPLLKIKLGGAGDADRIAAVRQAAPDARLIVDANESWSASDLASNVVACARAGVELIEQPLPAGKDDLLASFQRTVPICADESIHDVASLEEIAGRYDAINIKLDKTGGLTGALALMAAAEAGDLAVMIGCMVGTSLAMAPAMLLAQRAAYVDLDGPLLLARDRVPGLVYDGSRVLPPEPELWG